MKSRLLLLTLIAYSAPTLAAIIDNFEDGDYTANPIWTKTNPETGDSMVTADPIRPNNMVVGGFGTETRHHVLETPTSTPWNAFDASVEFLDFNGEISAALFMMRGPDHFNNSNYNIIINLRSEPGWSNVELRVDQFLSNQPGHDRQTMFFDADPTGEWWRMHSWYDAVTDLVQIEIRTVIGGALVFDHSFTPVVDLDSEPAFDLLKIGFEETSLSYMDNVVLTPEPTTALILLSAIAMLTIQRRRRA